MGRENEEGQKVKFAEGILQTRGNEVQYLEAQALE